MRLFFFFLAAAGVPAFAQSFNIDLGPPGSAPSVLYRAEGLPGVWNSFEGVAFGPYALVDVHGIPTGASVTQIGGTEVVQDLSSGPGDPEGNDYKLMGDALVTHSTLENCIFFDGLQAGTYEVLTYAWMPTAPSTPNRVRIDGSPTITIVSGSWPGGHVHGTTFARHVVQAPFSGSFDVGQHSGVENGDFGVGAALNGIQIRLITAEPPLFASRTELSWLSAGDATSYDVVRGDLNDLRASGGDFSQAIESCLGENLAAFDLAYQGPEPDPGNGFFYLVRGVGSHGGHTYDSPGDTQVGTRDPEIDASPLACN